MTKPEKASVVRPAPRLAQILRVLVRHKFLGALLGRSHWPSPKEVREAFEELGLVFLKFGQVLAMRRDLLPAATIARVHEATMKDRRHVAVKVQRPGLEATISTDIAALTYLMALGERLFPRLRANDLPVVVREFARSLHREPISAARRVP